MKKFAAAALVSLAVAGLPVLAPTTGAAASPADHGSQRQWEARSYQRGGVSVSELTNGTTTVRVFGGGSELRRPEIGLKEAQLEVHVPESTMSRRSPSIYDMSIASGMTAEEACEFAEGMDPYGCGSAPATGAARPAALAGLQGLAVADVATTVRPEAIVAPMSESADDFLGSICYDLVTYEGDGSKHAHGCNSRYHDAWTSTNRWIANKMKVTGWSENPGWYNDRINGVGIQAQYTASDSTATDWDPYTTETIADSCREVTTSAEGRSGFSYSTSRTICPDKLNPWHSPMFQYFGAKWTGDAADEEERRGAVATSVHRIPRSQGYSADTNLWIRWN